MCNLAVYTLFSETVTPTKCFIKNKCPQKEYHNVVTNIRIYGYKVRYYLFIQNENGHELCKLQAHAHYVQEISFQKNYSFMLSSTQNNKNNLFG